MKNQPRRKQLRNEVDRLKNSIKADGPEEPIKVRLIAGDPKHSYELISGETRWIAHGELGIEEIWAIVDEKIDNRKDQLRSAVRSNANRRGLRGLEIANTIKEMRDLGCTNSEIMRDFGFESQFPIDQHLRILTLPESLQRLMYPHVESLRKALSPAVAYWLARLPSTERKFQEQLAQQIFEKEISVSSAIRQIKKKLRDTTSRKRRVEKPSKDFESFMSFLARSVEGVSRFVELPIAHYDRMFGSRPLIAKKAAFAQIDELVSTLTKVRKFVEKCD